MSPLGRAPRHPHPVPPARAPRTAATTAGSAWACRAHTAPLLQHAARPGWGRGSAEHRALRVATVNEAPAPCSPAFLQAPRPQVRRSLRTGERCPQDLGLTARPTRGSAGSPAALTLSVRPGGRVRPPLGRQTELRGPAARPYSPGPAGRRTHTGTADARAEHAHVRLREHTCAHTHASSAHQRSALGTTPAAPASVSHPRASDRLVPSGRGRPSSLRGVGERPREPGGRGAGLRGPPQVGRRPRRLG